MMVDPYLVSGGVCFSFPVAPEGPRLLSPSAPTSRPPAESDPRHESGVRRRGRLGASEAWTRELGPILIIGHRNPQPGRQPFESHKAARYELSSADAATHWFFNRRDKKSSRGTWQAALLAGHSALSPRFVDESHAHPDTVSGANGANQKHPPSYTTPSQPVSVLEVPFFIGHLTLLQESFVSVMDGQNFPSALREHEHVNSTPGADVITPTTMERHEEEFMHVAEKHA